MDEAEQLCDRLVVMDNGKIVAEGSPAGLIQEHTPRDVVELRFRVGTLDTITGRIEEFSEHTEILADRALLYTDDAEELVARISESDLEPETELVRRSSLEDVFLRLTGRTLID
jgi:lipooligosaccharide transport system ATP-binding protein